VDLSDKFVSEGSMELGPKEDFFIFLDGDHLGRLLRKHCGVEAESGYTPLGWPRITVERVDGAAAPAESPVSET
jgi:hypothetical protein